MIRCWIITGLTLLFLAGCGKDEETPTVARSADVRIIGEVIDGASGRPLAGMEVRAKITGGIFPRSPFSDGAGRYEIVYEDLAALYWEEEARCSACH